MTRRRASTSTRQSSRGRSFQLYAPNRTLWFVALVLFLVGLSGTVLDIGITVARQYALWALILSSGILLFGTAARTS